MCQEKTVIVHRSMNFEPFAIYIYAHNKHKTHTGPLPRFYGQHRKLYDPLREKGEFIGGTFHKRNFTYMTRPHRKL